MKTSSEQERSPKQTLRVLQVFGTLGVGGAETWLLSLLKYFNASADELGYRVQTDICLTGGARGELDGEAERLGARLHYIRYGRDTIVNFTRQFRKLLSDNRYDAIHDHQDYSAGIHFLLAGGALPSVRIAHVHNPPIEFVDHRSRSSRWAQLVGRQVLRRSHVTVAGTSGQLLKEYGFEVSHDKADDNHAAAARAVYCGFDLEPYTGDRDVCRSSLRAEMGWPADAPVLLFVGRLGGDEITMGGVSHKNPRFALRVFEEAARINPNLRIVFAGEKGKMHDVLSALTVELNLADSARFLGLRRDVPRLMLGADLLLFPSSAEGLGMVAVEAQAAGLPVLASDRVPAECVVIPELVRFLSLDLPVSDWVRHVIELTEMPRPDLDACNAAVASSAFSIATSASQLVAIYSGAQQLR